MWRAKCNASVRSWGFRERDIVFVYGGSVEDFMDWLKLEEKCICVTDTLFVGLTPRLGEVGAEDHMAGFAAV